MAKKILGKTPLWWGTKNQDQVWGLCNNVSEKQEAEKEEIRDGDNDVVGVTFSGGKRTFSLEYTPIVSEGSDLPTASSDLVGGTLPVTPPGEATALTCIIDDAEKKTERGKVATFSLNVTYYPELTLPAG